EELRAHGFLQRVIAARLHELRGGADLFLARRTQEPGRDEGEATLQKAEEEEGFLEARGLDHGRDRKDRGGRAGTITTRRETDGKTAAVREPFQRVVDAGGVDRADTDAADGRACVKAHQAGGLRIDDPGKADEDGAERNHEARAELVDEIAL